MNGFSIAPSALAYLYGDLLQDTFASSALVSFPESLPCRDVKVKKTDLATAILVTGFVYLAKEDCLRLSIGSRGFLVKSKCVLVARTPCSTGRQNGLEEQILANLTGKAKDDCVNPIVQRVLRKDSVDPWGAVIREVQRYLLGLGYYAERERQGVGKLLGKELVPQCDKILALQAEVSKAHDMLASFRSAQGELYVQLWKDAGAGITARQETPDVDMA